MTRYTERLIVLIQFTILMSSCQKSNLSLISDQIPTDTPSIFAPGIISTDNFEFAITFNPEMNELFFTRRKPEETNKIFRMFLDDGKWSSPELAFFSTDEGWDFEPHIDPKGNRLYFGSTRPLPDTTQARGMHQWYSEKKTDGWSQPLPLGKPFVDRFSMYITSSSNGKIYFTSAEEGARPEDGGIYYSTKEESQYKSVTRMGEEINFSGKWIAHSYIAPDESYIIYDGEGPDGFGDCDLYISFNKDGNWTKSQNLGPKINSEKCEMCASVSPDGKYLFFYRGGDGEGNIYWVDFKLVQEKIQKAMKDRL